MTGAIHDFHHGRACTRAEFESLVAACAAQLRGRLPELAARKAGEAGAPEPGPRVAALSRNGIELLALMFACFRTGAVFVSLNWRLSPHELAALLADCTPALLYSQREFLPLLAGTTVPCHELEAGFGDGQFTAPEGPDEQLALLLYTSGTSGRPKGAMLTLGNLRANARNFAAVADVTPQSGLLCDAPMFHIIGLLSICFTSVTVGAKLLLSPAFRAEDTLERIGDASLGITHYFTVPQVAQLLLAAPTFAPRKFTRLRALFTGGAPLTPELIAAWRAHGVQIVNGYGSSEAGTSIHMPLDASEAFLAKPASIGLPAPLMEVSLHDRDGRAVGEGEVGEIWLRGPSIMQGYWNQPGESAKALAGGWFHTGDAARRDADGAYTLVDRWKDMYISGGENVYPAEVEAVIRQLPAVAEVAVVGQPDAKWGEVGEAFVVLKAGEALAAEAIIQHVRTELAHYKCPRAVTFIEALPRTASGKVQKVQLRRS